MRRGRLIAGLSMMLVAVAAVPAKATFHEMVVQEVFPGSTAHPGQDYVALQMYAPGQSFVGGRTLTVYSAAGAPVGDGATFPDDVANGQNQATILIGGASTVLGVTSDLVDADLQALDPAGGAVCWAGVDCVAWGSFPQSTVLTPTVTKTDTALDESAGDLVFVRNYAQRGCSTALESVDDTDVMDADFSTGSAVPRNNGSTPTEEACFNTQITKGPEGKTTDKTPTFKFKSIPGGAPQFNCAVAEGAQDPNFNTCPSPFTLPKQSLGKHKFYVEAVNSQNGEDPSPDVQTFKVVKRRR